MNVDAITKHLDLTRFCANDLDPREYLRAPWKVGEWVFCTNGHLALRLVAADYPEVAETTAAVPDVGALFIRTVEDRVCEYQPMPAIQRLVKCLDCDGSGNVRAVKCRDCTEGSFRHGEHVYECHNCCESPAGAGWEFLDEDCETQPHEVERTCHTCDGLGFCLRQNGWTRVGEAYYANVYLAMMDSLPNVFVCPGTSARLGFDGPKEVPAAFIFDGGHGLLMPFRN